VELVEIADSLRAYSRRETRELPLDALDLSGMSLFQERVLRELRGSVPYGEMISYGELAKLAGFPGAARAVGTALRRNPFPLFFPCHRVTRADGSVGLFQGSISGGRLKRRLLTWEADSV
jgi:methylated-DNA-[protein]-cysteine S-methyltransferase